MTPPSDPDDRYVTTRGAAAFIGYSQGTLRNWRSQGRGPAWTRAPGGTVRYLVADLRAFMAAGA